MNSREAQCIYCLSMFSPDKGEGDHVLPRAFGDFKGAIIFRGLCSSCNNRLSPLEEELLRTAPEAVLRRHAGATRSRKGKPTGWQAASGVPPPRFVIKHTDHDELMDADPGIPHLGHPVDQLVILLKSGRQAVVRLFPSMTVESLRRKLTDLKILDADIARVHVKTDGKHASHTKNLIQELWPGWRYEDLPDIAAGTHKVPVRIEFTTTQKYYRAIAKIALHYLLAETRCGFTGHEPSFAPIRQFIMEGGDQQAFFEAQKPTIDLPVGVLPDGTALLPTRWMHLLCGFERAASAVVAVYTLFGPESPPTPHFVTLFEQPTRFMLRQHQYGHMYVYGNPELGDTREAFVETVILGVRR